MSTKDKDEEDLGLRSEKDGGFEGEDLPVVREGEVYMATSPDDHRRFVKVLIADDDGRGVLVQNEESYRKSHIGRDRFTPEHGWKRFAS